MGKTATAEPQLDTTAWKNNARIRQLEEHIRKILRPKINFEKVRIAPLFPIPRGAAYRINLWVTGDGWLASPRMVKSHYVEVVHPDDATTLGDLLDADVYLGRCEPALP